MVLIHRWSLYAGSITWKACPWGPVKCGLCKYRVGGLYVQVVFRAGFTVVANLCRKREVCCTDRVVKDAVIVHLTMFATRGTACISFLKFLSKLHSNQ